MFPLQRNQSVDLPCKSKLQKKIILLKFTSNSNPTTEKKENVLRKDWINVPNINCVNRSLC